MGIPARPWRDGAGWLLALVLTAAGAWLRLRGVLTLDLQGNEVGYVDAPLADSLGLTGLLYYAPLRPVLTALALAVDPSPLALRALAWIPGVLVPLAFFAAFRRVAGPAVALAGAALLAFDEGQVWGSVVSGVYALVALLQIGLLAAHGRVTRSGDARAVRAWTAAGVALVLAHYLLIPLVALTALTGWLALRRHADAALRARWRRAVGVVGLVALPLGLLVLWGLATSFLLTAGGGLEATRAVGFVELWRLDLVPFGLWRPWLNGVVVATGVAATFVLGRRLAWPAVAWLGLLAVMLAAVPFVPRMQAYHAMVLHVPLLAFAVEALAALASARPRLRPVLTGALLALTGLATALGLGWVRPEPAGWLTGSEPPYAPLHELASTLSASPGLPSPVLVYPPGPIVALALQRRVTLDLAPCTDRVDDHGVVHEVTCPEGTIRAAWPTADQRHIAWGEPPPGPWLAAVERVKVWGLEGRWPDRAAWNAADVPPGALGLPPDCTPVPAEQWLLYRCPGR